MWHISVSPFEWVHKGYIYFLSFCLPLSLCLFVFPLSGPLPPFSSSSLFLPLPSSQCLFLSCVSVITDLCVCVWVCICVSLCVWVCVSVCVYVIYIYVQEYVCGVCVFVCGYGCVLNFALAMMFTLGTAALIQSFLLKSNILKLTVVNCGSNQDHITEFRTDWPTHKANVSQRPRHHIVASQLIHTNRFEHITHLCLSKG